MHTTFESLVERLNYQLSEFRSSTRAYIEILLGENKRLTEDLDGWQRVVAKLEAQLKQQAARLNHPCQSQEPDKNCMESGIDAPRAAS